MAFAGVYVGSLVAITKMAEVLSQISTHATGFLEHLRSLVYEQRDILFGS
jgi:hypothetical protein